MTDEGIPPTHDPDDVVGQVVERAAIKVAEVASSGTVGLCKANVMTRVESFLVVAVLVVLLFTNLLLNIQTKNAVEENSRKVEAACKLANRGVEAPNDPAATVRLAECLK